MAFELDKKNCLSKTDKSKKGDIDLHIRKLCDTINALPNFYTTSSCSGRTVLISVPASGRKQDSEWMLCSHDPVSIKQVNSALSTLKQEDIWFRFEPPILHVCAKTIDNAGALLNIVYSLGFKRSGIMSVGKKNVIEMMATERIDCPVVKGGKKLIDDDYLELLVNEANKKLAAGHAKIGKVTKALMQSR
ncbi:hypothetical protein HY772_09245 [Candidatus Woesearchaeota archaeon]|nr:hypothetical protein [Candidatus Woesearchaeota archaeon]